MPKKDLAAMQEAKANLKKKMAELRPAKKEKLKEFRKAKKELRRVARRIKVSQQIAAKTKPKTAEGAPAETKA
jgi:hypothetical protein